MTQSNDSHEANGERHAQSHLSRARRTKLVGGLSKTAMIAALVASWTMIGEATVPSDVAAQEQPPLPPVTVESPTPRPRAAPQPTARATTTRAKRAARRTNRTATRRNPTSVPVTANVTPPQPAAPKEGSEAAGYKPTTVSNLGPLGQTPILDVPYSVNVIPSSLIENTQIYRNDDLYRIDPTIQTWTSSSRGDSTNMVLRGFTFAASAGRAEDGMIAQNLLDIPLEDKERVEVYTGLTSFLFGPTNVGGLLNYVYKRPTDAPLANFTVGTYGGLSGYAHGDFGGPIHIPGLQDGTFTYRLNILGQDGAAAVDNQSTKRDLVTTALTWHITNDAALTVIGSHEDQIMKGIDAYWAFATNPDGSSKAFHPAAPNATTNFSQPFTGFADQRDRIGADIKWKLNEIFTLRTSYAWSEVTERNDTFVNNSVSLNNGMYSQTIFHNPDYSYFASTGYAFIDSDFDIGFVHNKITTGFYGNDYRSVTTPTTYASGTVGNLNFVTPVYVAQPAFTASKIGAPPRTSTYNNAKNTTIGDQIKLNDQWSLLAGAVYTDISSRNFSTSTGTLTSSYDGGKLSPSASVLFKPVPWLSTYATYSQSLQSGTVVPSTGSMVYTNAGQTLSPYTGTEYEVGAKANLGNMLLTASIFQIEQALQYSEYNNNGTYTYVQDGRQRSRGLELTAVGNIMEGLRIFGGITLLDARVTQSNTSATSPSLNGMRPPNVANQMEKITAEYDLPFINGLTLTGGFYFTGQQAVDTRNTEFLPSFTTEDVGFRYRTAAPFGYKLPFSQELILRFNVTNVTNKSYWLDSYYVGQPRTFLASAEIKF